MIDLSGVFVVLLFIFLVIVALAVALKLLGLSLGDYPADPGARPARAGDDEGQFLESFLRPLYEDGLDEVEDAVDAVRDGLDLYGRGAFVEAGEEFIAARRSLEAATRKFREVRALVEDPAEAYTKSARNRLIECQMFQKMAEAMEGACDASLDGREVDAKGLEEQAADLRKMAAEWKKE